MSALEKLKENLNKTWEYVDSLEEQLKEAKADKLKYGNCLEKVRGQLYDANNCETVLTKAIDSVLNKEI